MDNAYQAIVVCNCPECGEQISLEMPSQEIHDKDYKSTVCTNCGQKFDVMIHVLTTKIYEHPPF